MKYVFSKNKTPDEISKQSSRGAALLVGIATLASVLTMNTSKKSP